MRWGEAKKPGPAFGVETFNRSCNATARDRATRTQASVFCIQEHRVPPGTDHAEASANWLRDGWKFASSPAVSGQGGGASAGVAVLVRKHIGARSVGTQQPDLPFEIAQGRAAGVLVEGGVPGGILIVSVYLKVGTGLCEENWETLLRIG